jgi:hypothetical protein
MGIVLFCFPVGFAQQPTTVSPSPYEITPLPFNKAVNDSFTDSLEAEIGYLKNPQAVAKTFNGKLWRKNYGPFQFTFTNQGHYPIEISTANILLLDQIHTPQRVSSQLNQLQATAKSSTTSNKQVTRKPFFIAPTPPGVAFSNSKHLQYGWKSNLGLVALTGVTLGLATPLTAPAMVLGNVHRGSNKRLVNTFQDQSLGRIILDPGESATTWIFYRRAKKNQREVPQKILISDLYCPELDQLSGITVDFQPLTLKQPAIRRTLSESEKEELALYNGKVLPDKESPSERSELEDLKPEASATEENEPEE